MSEYHIGDEYEFGLHRTKRGLPALWESGGGLSNTGSAMIVAAPDGAPKRAVYIARRGSLCCGEHALIVVDLGDLIITARHHRRDFTIKIMQIVGFETDETKNRDIARAKLIAYFDEGEWDPSEPTGLIAEAVEAARQKAVCYHCRSPHWIADEE